MSEHVGTSKTSASAVDVFFHSVAEIKAPWRHPKSLFDRCFLYCQLVTFLARFLFKQNPSTKIVCMLLFVTYLCCIYSAVAPYKTSDHSRCHPLPFFPRARLFADVRQQLAAFERSLGTARSKARPKHGQGHRERDSEHGDPRVSRT
jgi:hypothetical protein